MTQPQTLLIWKQSLEQEDEVDFKKLFSKRKEEGKKLFSLPSFTAPDTEVLQSFSGLDPRLKQCLGISQLIDKYLKLLRMKKSHFRSYWAAPRSSQLLKSIPPPRILRMSGRIKGKMKCCGGEKEKPSNK